MVRGVQGGSGGAEEGARRRERARGVPSKGLDLSRGRKEHLFLAVHFAHDWRVQLEHTWWGTAGRDKQLTQTRRTEQGNA